MSDATDHPVQSTIHSASPTVPGRPNVAAGNGGAKEAAAAVGPQGDRSAQRGTILVIDPAPLSLIALAGVLDTEGYTCICARTAAAAREAMRGQKIETVVCDVGDDAPAMLELLAELRQVAGEAELPAVLIADQRWVGLEKKVESLDGTTRCLFKPIDPGSLLAVVEQLLWMPQVVSGHRKRGTRPGRPGWVSL